MITGEFEIKGKDCSFHQPGTEPEIKKPLLKQIKEFMDAF